MPGPRPEQLGTTEYPLAVRLILADTQAIFSAGVRKILTPDQGIRIVAQTDSLGQTLAAVSKIPADVLLFESRLSSAPAEAVSEILKRAPLLKIVVLVSEESEQETLDLFRRGVRGIATRSIGPELLVRCMRKVAEGETWLGNRGVNWVMQAFRRQAAQLVAAPPKTRLSEKELIIISGVAHGLRNKDIAREIGTTEQVIKNSLRKIYEKLEISDRLELALYCVHQRLLDKQGGPLPLLAPPAEPRPESPIENVISSAPAENALEVLRPAQSAKTNQPLSPGRPARARKSGSR
ncbi:MAG: LuxR C-terminal-related transcriptional regulator [Terriglobales bacterium]